MITLYHGSNVVIDDIDLDKCRPGKDFGKGFYLNPNYEQALGMAVKATRIMMDGQAIVNAFQFDETLCEAQSANLKIKIFDDYTVEWAEFIVNNRRNKSNSPIHDYDIVIGPIADDSVGVQIRRFIEGYLPADKLVEELRFHGDRAVQYYFGTERAIKLLNRIEL